MKTSKDKIVFEKTPKQYELLQKLGSKNQAESLAAQEALAAALSQPILQVIEQAPVISNQFQKQTYDAGTAPSVPLDPFFDVKQRNFLQIWGQSQAGGNATNLVQAANEVYVGTYELDSAIELKKRWLRGNRIDVLQSVVNRLLQEILWKRNTNAATVLLTALANARIDGVAANGGTNGSNYQLLRTQTAGTFSLVDFNNILTKYSRVLTSWLGGTPAGGSRGRIDTLMGSPEWMGQIRSIAYQPVNTRAGSIGTTQSNTSLAAPESVRDAIFNSGGVPTLYDVDLLQYQEFGIGQQYNLLFNTAIGGTSFVNTAGTGTATFTQTSEEIIVGLNSDMFGLVNLAESDAGSTFTLQPDTSQNILNPRMDNIGFFGSVTEGYCSLENRNLEGIVM